MCFYLCSTIQLEDLLESPRLRFCANTHKLGIHVDLDQSFSFYAIFFVIAAAFSIAIYSLLLRFVRNLGVRDNIDQNRIRWAASSKPSIGGLGFYILFLLSFSVMAFYPMETETGINLKLLGIFAASTLGFFIGLADDAYDTRPLLKFIGQLTCANILIGTGVYITVSGSLAFNYAFTMLWVVGMMNSLNMLDNMDGITASVSSSAIIGAIAIAFANGAGETSLVVLFYGVLAALVGFLWFNWNPARMYMGDTGSMFLGVFLAATGILLFWNNRLPTSELIQIKQFLIPLMIFVMPITDTITVFMRRIARGQSPFVGGRDHTTHQIAFLGVPDGWVAAIFALLSFIGTDIAYYIYDNQGTWTFSQTLVVVVGYLIFFGLMQVVYEMGKKKQLAREQEEEAHKDSSVSALGN